METKKHSNEGRVGQIKGDKAEETRPGFTETSSLPLPHVSSFLLPRENARSNSK